jgi:Zn-dependent protease
MVQGTSAAMELQSHDLVLIAQGMIILVLSIAVHEFGHAIVATWLGDDTPSRQGRVTLNPVAHADPLGTLILPLVSMILMVQAGRPPGIGFGWGKPVEHNARNINRKIGMQTGQALIAIAGPSMNLMLGSLLAGLHVALVKYGVVDPGKPISDAILMASSVNFFLLFFNLLPIPPLDGGWVLQWATPYKYRRYIDHYNVYAPFVFMAVVFIPQLRFLFQWPADQVAQFMYHSFGSIFGVRIV